MPRKPDADDSQVMYTVTAVACAACVDGEGGLCTSAGCVFEGQEAPVDLRINATVVELP